MGYDGALVTGGAGFIGSHLVDKLARDGVNVTVLDDLSTGKMENLSSYAKSQKINFVRGDIRARADVEDAFQHIDAGVVFHLAAKASIPFSVKHPKVTHEVNVGGTRNLLEACLRASVEKFIYVSSCAVYGDPKYLPIDEGHPLNPISPYAESKLKAEQVCAEFQEAYGLKATIMRLFNVYGPRQRNDQYSGVMSKFIERLRNGKPPIIYGDGLQTRDFIHVEDVVRAFVLASKNDRTAGRIFNVAAGVPTSVNQLASLFLDLFQAEGIEPQHVSARRGDIRHSYADINEARIWLGFEPLIPLKEGLSNLLGVRKHARD